MAEYCRHFFIASSTCSLRPGVGTVLGQLGPEPAMQGRQHVQVAGFKHDLTPGGQITIGYFDVGGAGLQLFNPRHIRAVQFGGVRVIPALKTPGFVPEVLANTRNLIGFGCIPGDDLLDAAEFRYPEDMHGFGHAEGHDTVSLLVDMLLTGLGGPGTAIEQKQEN